jgi:hypothetical protein
MLPHLHPLPTRMRLLFDNRNQRRHLIENCRTINNLFSFAGIGVTGGFQHFAVGDGAGPPAVAITGRTYHLLCNTEIADHSIHWFLYDEALRSAKAIQFSVHATVVQAVKDDLSHVNPYVASLHHFRATPRQRQQVIEPKDYSSNGDFAAVMHASNSTTINPRSILIRRHGSSNPQYINILSHHYEPLHYTLFFPHGEIGWGSTSVPGVPPLSQMDWYRNRVLADDDDRFSTLGRLCCEYLVDMYSRTEEQRLLYIS